MGDMTAAHFIFIPSVLLIGMVIGWVFGSRAARDAFASELRKREERGAAAERQTVTLNSQATCAKTEVGLR